MQAFAEWVLFTASGISSGLYHACDVGTWCALSFGVLQVYVSTIFFFSKKDDNIHHDKLEKKHSGSTVWKI